VIETSSHRSNREPGLERAMALDASAIDPACDTHANGALGVELDTERTRTTRGIAPKRARAFDERFELEHRCVLQHCNPSRIV
jgi:hypothetical protein